MVKATGVRESDKKKNQKSREKMRDAVKNQKLEDEKHGPIGSKNTYTGNVGSSRTMQVGRKVVTKQNREANPNTNVRKSPSQPKAPKFDPTPSGVKRLNRTGK